jgi:benzaldehyde dehydrogenase (NAD)
VRPTVPTGVTPSPAAFSEEIFGPIAPVTTFADDDEAVVLANQTESGLSSSIYSRDIARAQRLAARLPTGMAHINDQTVNGDPRAPFGGSVRRATAVASAASPISKSSRPGAG